MRGSRRVDTALEAEPMRPAIAGGPCDECPPGRIARLAGAGRIVAGVVSLVAAAWWAFRALREWRRTIPIVDPEFRLRVTPLSRAERAVALERERVAAGDVRL